MSAPADLATARRELEERQAEARGAADELGNARTALAVTKASLVITPTAELADQAAGLTAAVARAEMLADAHRERVAQAAAAVREAERVDARERIVGHQEACSATLGRVAPVVARVVALERELWQAVEQLAAETDRHDQNRDAITKLAAVAGVPPASVVPRPVTLDLTIALCQVACSRARDEEGRGYLPGAEPFRAAVGGLLGLTPDNELEVRARPQPTEAAPLWREAESLLPEILTHD